MKFYQALYGDAFIDLCERGIARMTQGGALIGISSPGCNLSYSANPGYSLPGSGKCIMEYSMRIIAKTAGPKDINCNVIVPGVTLSEAWDRVAETRGVKTGDITDRLVEARVPMKRPIATRGIGDVAAFLCSDKGRYITGISLPVDGGLHLG
jgi:enoyl-[acyl-carrier-protein] reductase (NADH)